MIRNQYLLACSLFKDAEEQNDFWGMFVAMTAIHAAMRFMGTSS